MFQSKQVEEAESESDWDSLPGDVPEPTSSPETTPRHQPAPPKNTPKSQDPHKRPQMKSQPVVNTPEKQSALNSTVTATNNKSKPSTPSSNKPSQFYGKPGVTSFVDRGLTTETFSDDGLEGRPNKELESYANDNRLIQHHGQGGRKNGNTAERNTMDSNHNPPFIDFQGALTKQDQTKPEQSEKPNRGRIKSSYVLRNETNKNDNHSWDSESEREEEPVSHSRQQLTETVTEKNTMKAPVEQRKEDGIVQMGVYVDDDQKTLDTCRVPMGGRRQITGSSYHFDHGHNHHLDVKPEWREPRMKRFADRSEKWLHYFWQEFFSTLRIVTDFAFIFALELIKFVVHYVVLRLLGGLVIVIGDQLLKPYLAILFNSIIQPVFIFTRNVFTALKNVLMPLLDITRDIIAQIASLLRAFRLFELNWKPTFEGQRKHDVHVL